MAYDGDDRGRWQTLLPTARVEFPADFLWGVASSAFQAEGGDVSNDWVEAARRGRVPPNPGNGFWERAEEDFALVASFGIRHYRLSVEWSRVQPEPDRFDEAAVDRYRAMCDAAVAAGLTPWINLFHFTHPLWFARSGGFLVPAGAAAFLRYVEHIGGALAPHARHFHVSNESMVYVVSSYLLGTNPPFIADRDIAFDMTRKVLTLHADAHRALKAIDPAVEIATIEVYLDPRPIDATDPAQQAAVQSFDGWYHGTLLEALASGWIRLPQRDPVEVPHLKGALDAYGFNYYSATGFGAGGPQLYSDIDDPPIDAMGRAVFPRGMEEGLVRVASDLPGVPLLVTENGCPTTDERFRIRYIAAHLGAIERARRSGAPVRGYFHWTAVDNYEWHQGFSDARFGLIAFDPATGARRPKRSAHWLQRIIAAQCLAPADVP